MDTTTLPNTKAALDRFLDEHEASPADRAASYLAYARGKEDDIALALETVRANGELLMQAIGNPCEAVPQDEPTIEEIEAALMTAEECAELEEIMAQGEPSEDLSWTEEGEGWRDDGPSHWTDQGESWRD